MVVLRAATAALQIEYLVDPALTLAALGRVQDVSSASQVLRRILHGPWADSAHALR